MAGSLLIGVNLAGAEFGPPYDNFGHPTGKNVPGDFGHDYTYPTPAEIDYYAGKGMEVIRLPFLWERILNRQSGELDSAELDRLDEVVNYATHKGLKVEIEPHDYGYGFGALIGSEQTPSAAFADLWGKLAAHFKSNSDVIFGLMNEPHEQLASVWLASANAAIAAIRHAGAMQEILVPGSYWDGAWSWTTEHAPQKEDNATVVGTGVQDPAHNFAFEVHQYLDSDSSGTHPGVVSVDIGVQRLTAITEWAKASGNHLFLGEVGVTTDSDSLKALDLMLSYMQQNTDVWQGVTYWAGGPWWGRTMVPDFSIEPLEDHVDKPQMGILVAHLAAPAGNFNGALRTDSFSASENSGNGQLEILGNKNPLAGINDGGLLRTGGTGISSAAGNETDFVNSVVFENANQGNDAVPPIDHSMFANVQAALLQTDANNGTDNRVAIEVRAVVDAAAGNIHNDTFVFNVGHVGGATVDDLAGNSAMTAHSLHGNDYIESTTLATFDATYWQNNCNEDAGPEFVIFMGRPAVDSADVLLT